MYNDIVERNNVKVFGEGQKTILFAHGFGCDQSVWRDVAPAFSTDYRVVLFDYVGSGNSDKSRYSTERYDSLNGYAQDVIDVCDALELENIVFVGHSVSSMIGALASIERPGIIEKLIMIGPSPHYLNEPGYVGGFDKSDVDALLDMMEINYREWAKYLAPVVMGEASDSTITKNFENTLCSNDPVISRKFAEVTFTSDSRDMLGEITSPTLILQTQFDAIVPMAMGEYLHTKITTSEFVLMEATGHNPHLSYPEETVTCIKAYLTK